jgi:hypothetical protein
MDGAMIFVLILAAAFFSFIIYLARISQRTPREERLEPPSSLPKSEAAGSSKALRDRRRR